MIRNAVGVAALGFTALLVGCGSGGGGSDDESPATETSQEATSQAAGDAGGGPQGHSPGVVAPGTPITIPAFVESEGLSLDAMKELIENHLRNDSEACGDGTLCVTVSYAVTGKAKDRCKIQNVVPGVGSRIQRGKKITVSIACENVPTSSEETTPSTEETTDKPTTATTES